MVGQVDGRQRECGFRVTVVVGYPAAQAAGSVACPKSKGKNYTVLVDMDVEGCR